MATKNKGSVKKGATDRSSPAKKIAEKVVVKRSEGSTIDSIKVRMYCHGFGDCFLLTFLSNDQPVYRMVIDCGMLTGNSDTLRAAIENINKDTGGKVDVVIQTHEHKDHISGFNLKYSKGPKKGELMWDDIDVDNVWLAWTEAHNDDFANKLRDKKKKKTQALAKALNMFNNQITSADHVKAMKSQLKGGEYLAAQNRYATALGQMLQFYDIDVTDSETKAALNQGDNLNLGLKISDAMEYFHKRAAKGNTTISYFNPGDLAEEMDTGIGGVRFYFLGPPKDYSLLTTMDDKSHTEMYLTDMGLADNFYMALNNAMESSESLSPFHKKYCIPVEAGKSVKVIVNHEKMDAALFAKGNPDEYCINKPDEISSYEKCKSILSRYYYEANNYRRIESDWLHNAGVLALHLDTYTNNTSLVMAIEFIESGRVLLFVGDAQIGNWLSWTQPVNDTNSAPKLKWHVKKDGRKETVIASNLLEHTVFYKVGHHASHNATARKHGLELMCDPGLVAMIPVDSVVAKKQGKKGWKMPAEDLYNRLQQKTKGRIIRVDEGNILKAGKHKLVDGAKPTAKQIKDFEKNITESDQIITTDYGKKRPLYLEYEVKSKG